MSFYIPLECSQQTNTTKKGRKPGQTELLTNTGSSSSGLLEIGSRAKRPNSGRYFVKSKNWNCNISICSFFFDLCLFFDGKRKDKWQEPVKRGPRLPFPLMQHLGSHLSWAGTTQMWHKTASRTPQFLCLQFCFWFFKKNTPTFLMVTYKISQSWQILLIFFQAGPVFRLTEQFTHDGFF